MQLTFSPVNFGFSWTSDWYQFDEKEATKSARAARDQRAKEEKAKGKTVRKWTNSRQTIRRGGIGTGHPEIDLECSVFMLEVSDR